MDRTIRMRGFASRRKYFQGRSIRGADVKDIYWLDPSGREMTDEAWNAPFVRSLGVLMVGDAIGDTDERGRQVSGDTLLIQGRTVVLFRLEKHRPYRRASDHEVRERMALQVTR